MAARRARYQSSIYPPYVPQSARRALAAREAERARAAGHDLQPVVVAGRAIAASFWGKAWCDNLERYLDFANRLPRGRTYVRNGSVIDLRTSRGAIDARVSGSDLYRVEVRIAALAPARWRKLVAECSGAIGSLLELLRGQFSNGVMQVLTKPESGLFPAPKEMQFTCSCPDHARMCKHVAAVLYGIGARLDREPELFFTLRGVDSSDLIAAAASAQGLADNARAQGSELANDDLGAVFGIDLDTSSAPTVGGPLAAASPAIDRTAADGPGVPAATPRRRGRRRVDAAAAEPAAGNQADGFEQVFGPGLEVTEALLAAFGIGRPRIRRWLADGILVRTRLEAVHRTTDGTLDLVRAAYGRSRPSPRRRPPRSP
jgi:uncharacterized Zn finger protein